MSSQRKELVNAGALADAAEGGVALLHDPGVSLGGGVVGAVELGEGGVEEAAAVGGGAGDDVEVVGGEEHGPQLANEVDGAALGCR